MGKNRFSLEHEVKRIKGHMMTFEEFESILKRSLKNSLRGFPRDEISEYIRNEVPQIENLQEKYNEGVKRYQSRAEDDVRPYNMGFFGPLAQLENVLTLCF